MCAGATVRALRQPRAGERFQALKIYADRPRVRRTVLVGKPCFGKEISGARTQM